MIFLNNELLIFIPVAALVAGLLVLVNWRRRKAMQAQFGDWDLPSQTSNPLSRNRIQRAGRRFGHG